MTALLALALAAAPGCPAALAAAAASADADLAARAPALVEALEDAGAGPTAGLAAAARALAAPGPAPASAPGAAAAFRGALARHCALAAEPAAPAASAADRAALGEVLARPELSRLRLDPWAIRRALLRAWDRIVELLGTTEAERYASLGRALFVGVAAGAAVLAAAALGRRRRGDGGAPRGAAERGASGERAPETTAVEAEAALRRGDGREAVRLALLAAVAALEGAGRVPRGRALTNEEIVRVATSAAASDSTSTSTSRSTNANATFASDLALLAHAFDRAVYGGRPVPADDARAAVERARRVAAAAGGAA